MTEFDLATTETVEESWLSFRAQRLLLVIAVLLVAAGSLVGSAMLARADTGDVRPATDEESATAVARNQVSDLALEFPAATLGTPLPDHDTPVSTPEASGAIALENFPFDWQRLLPGWTIEFAGSHEELLGGTSWQDQRITIWIRPEQTIGQIRHVVAHELGHALDVTYFDESVRVRWMVARGFAAEDAWWPESGSNDYASPAGDLAETMASWINGTEHWAGTGEAPTGSDLALMRELLLTSLS